MRSHSESEETMILLKSKFHAEPYVVFVYCLTKIISLFSFSNVAVACTLAIIKSLVPHCKVPDPVALSVWFATIYCRLSSTALQFHWERVNFMKFLSIEHIAAYRTTWVFPFLENYQSPVDPPMMNWWLIHYTAYTIHISWCMKDKNTVSLVTRCCSLNSFRCFSSFYLFSRSLLCNQMIMNLMFISAVFHSWRVPCFLHDSRHFQMDTVAHSVSTHYPDRKRNVCNCKMQKWNAKEHTSIKCDWIKSQFAVQNVFVTLSNALAIVAASTLQPQHMCTHTTQYDKRTNEERKSHKIESCMSSSCVCVYACACVAVE